MRTILATMFCSLVGLSGCGGVEADPESDASEPVAAGGKADSITADCLAKGTQYFKEVIVSAPLDREIYLNGNYEDALGPSPSRILLGGAGGHIAETRDADGRIDFRGHFRIAYDCRLVKVALEPVPPTE